jgi:hypothetical protein
MLETLHTKDKNEFINKSTRTTNERMALTESVVQEGRELRTPGRA